MQSVLRALARPLYPAASILCLHSVTTSEFPSDDPLHIPVPGLRALVRAVRRVAEFVPLDVLVRRHLAGQSTAGLVALTFDDAYAALREAVERVLVPEKVPATVFAVSDALSTGGSYWWDRLSEVNSLASAEQWEQFEHEAEVPPPYRQRGASVEDRFLRIRRLILAEHAGRLSTRLDSALATLEAALGHRCAQRSMTMAELRALAAYEGIRIGVHTCTHAVIPALSDADAIREIRDCHRALRDQLPNTVPLLAIPYGLFDARTASLSAQAGMEACLTLTGHALIGTGSDGVPRFCLDRRTSVMSVLLRTSGPAEYVRWIRGRRAADRPALPTPLH